VRLGFERTDAGCTDDPCQINVVPFGGTPLLHVKNTEDAVFKEPTDQEFYVHVDDGWFRAWTTNGPWQQVSESELPLDLARRGERPSPN
jgi:hypothetical protein